MPPNHLMVGSAVKDFYLVMLLPLGDLTLESIPCFPLLPFNFHEHDASAEGKVGSEPSHELRPTCIKRLERENVTAEAHSHLCAPFPTHQRRVPRDLLKIILSQKPRGVTFPPQWGVSLPHFQTLFQI